MHDREARELAELRRRLREGLIAQDVAGAGAPLARLREVAGDDMELRAEFERWSFRFELLAAQVGSGQLLPPLPTQVTISTS